MRKKMLWVLARYRRAWWLLPALLAFTLLSAVTSLLYPLVFKVLIDFLSRHAGAGQSDELVGRVHGLAIGLLVLGFFRFVAHLYPGFRGAINLFHEKEIRVEYFEYLLKKCFSFFQKFTPGDLITRLTSDLHDYPKLSWFCCSGVFRAVDSLSRFLFCFAAMLYIHPRLALLAVLPLPFMIHLYTRFSSSLREGWKKNREAVSACNQSVESLLDHIRLLKAYSCEGRALGVYEHTLDQRLASDFEVLVMVERLHALFFFCGGAGQLIVMGYGSYLCLFFPSELSIGDFYAFYLYLGAVSFPLLDIPNFFVQARQSAVLIDRLEEVRLFEGANEIDWNKEPRRQSIGEIESLEFRAVTFQRPDQTEPVLKNISFTLGRGEFLAMAGKVGSGKSTLLNIALGLERPTTGQVLVNGLDLTTVNRFSYWEKLGFLGENVFILNAPVRENILMGRPGSEEKLARTIRSANLEKEIESLPSGLAEAISFKGQSLSGGQKQRLALARALYADPGLLILDDLTSALDSANEEIILERLRARPDRLGLLATHRPPTLAACDRVVVLLKGEVAASGAHAELLEKSSLYREILQASAKPVPAT